MDLTQSKSLDDFMPKELQKDYFTRGLKTFSKVLSKKKFDQLNKGIQIINRYERKYRK